MHIVNPKHSRVKRGHKQDPVRGLVILLLSEKELAILANCLLYDWIDESLSVSTVDQVASELGDSLAEKVC